MIQLSKNACAVKMKIISGGRFKAGMGGEPMAQTFISRAGAPIAQPQEPGGLQQSPGLALLGLYCHPVGTGCRHFLLGRVCKGTEKCPVVSGLGSSESRAIPGWAG